MTAPDRRHAASSVAQIALLFGLPAFLPGDAWNSSLTGGTTWGRPQARQGSGRGRHSIRMMKGLAARNGGRTGLVALVAVLLLGVGLRVDYAWEGRAPVYDAVGDATSAM